MSEYSKTGDTHPEGIKCLINFEYIKCEFTLAVAEKLIATETIPDTPPVNSTEVVAAAPPTKLDTKNLELPS